MEIVGLVLHTFNENYFWAMPQTYSKKLPFVPRIFDGNYFLALQFYEGNSLLALQFYEGNSFLALQFYDGNSFLALQINGGNSEPAWPVVAH